MDSNIIGNFVVNLLLKTMPFEAGKSGNPSGRPMGAKNKNGTELGQYIVGEGQQKAMDILQKLDGVEYLTFYEKLMQYYTAKKRAVESRISLEHLPTEDIEEIWNRMLKEQQ